MIRMTVVNTSTSDMQLIRLTSANSTATGRIFFNSDSAGGVDGSLVEISISSSTSYTMDSIKPKISFRVEDGGNFPAVSITGNGIVSEGNDAIFTVSTDESDTSRRMPLMVSVLVSEGNTSFIAGTHMTTVAIPGRLNLSSLFSTNNIMMANLGPQMVRSP